MTEYRKNAKANMVLTHLLTTPNMANKLKRVHDMAIYESGATIEPEDKEDLRDTMELAVRLEKVTDEEVDFWKQLI